MGDKKRVLIVEDLATDAELAQREIRKVLDVGELRCVETREDYLSALSTFLPDLIVSDYQLPQFDGLAALKLALEYCPDVPFIIVTGSMNEDTAVECMKAGAWDYVIKEHVKRLGPAIQSAIERQHVKSERVKLEEQLRMSQKMEAIGSLAGGVAHDFNNLLSVILNYAGFAMEDAGDRLKDDLLQVKRAAERAAALTRQLLAFSRKQILQPQPLDLNQIAAGLEKMLRRILGEDIDFLQVLAPDVGVVRADPGQIEQVLMNLVVNARDAMPGGGKLTIETSNVEIDQEYAAGYGVIKPGRYVQLAVTDTGSGMDEKTRERIFEPFFTTKEIGKGTGLGLSTVYGIVTQSGGHVLVYSEPGVGTTFRICLPRERAAAVAMPIRSPTVTMRSKGNETILVVEDEEALREVARRILHAAGYDVLTAKDGDEAIELCAGYADDIHLLLTDVVMPRMSGRVLAERLVGARPTLQVLYMSGYTDEAIAHHGALDVGTLFVGKPFTVANLTAKVRKVLDEGVNQGQPQASVGNAPNPTTSKD
jgi:two-component system, cell cycle sensor histidine kinase and response regulator CckA